VSLPDPATPAACWDWLPEADCLAVARTAYRQAVLDCTAPPDDPADPDGLPWATPVDFLHSLAERIQLHLLARADALALPGLDLVPGRLDCLAGDGVAPTTRTETEALTPAAPDAAEAAFASAAAGVAAFGEASPAAGLDGGPDAFPSERFFAADGGKNGQKTR
jgi:hypothetical protein